MKLSDQITRRQLFLVAFGTSQATGGLTSVDLAATRDDNQVVLTASDGSAAPISGADAAVAGVMTAADKAALDALAAATIREFSARSDVPTTAIDASITHLRTAGFSSARDGGGALYKRVGAEPGHALKLQSGDGAWWELVPDPMGINVRQAGAVGDDTTDDSQAFIDAINGVEDFDDGGTDKATHRVIVPAGHYYLGSTTLELKRIVHVLGASSGLDNRPNPAKLRWDAQVTGIIVHNTDTIGATTEATPTGGANGSVVEGLELKSGGGTIANIADDTMGHGIWLRARAELRHVSVYDFPGHGVKILANQLGGSSIKGNANAWRMDVVRCAGNHLSGVYVNGSDANAGYGTLIDANNNGRWGIEDASFLGNSWVGCHESANGGNGTGENSGASCVADYNGSSYLLNVDASEADAVATQPGTDKSVWIEDSGLTQGVAWTGSDPEGTFHHGGGYKSTGPNARTVFIGCYTEPGKGSQFKKPTVWIGGHETFDTHGSHGGFAPDVNKTRMRGSYELSNLDSQWPIEPGRPASLQLNWNTASLMQLLVDGDSGDGLRLAVWQDSIGMWGVEHSSGGKSAMRYSTTLTTRSYGRPSVDPGMVAFEDGFFLGQYDNARHMWNDTAAPTNGNHARGEIRWNRDQSTGGCLGWVCTASGSPGTWAEIRGVGTQQSHIADPSGGTTVDAEARSAINSILGVLEHFGLTAAI